MATLPKTAIQFKEHKGQNLNRTLGAKTTLDRRNDCDSPLMMAEKNKFDSNQVRKRSQNGRESARFDCEKFGSPNKMNRTAFRGLVKEGFVETE